MNYAHEQEIELSRISAKKIVAVVMELCGSPNSIVDVGGGTGSWSAAFKQAGATKVCCLDHPSAATSELLIAQDEFQPVDLVHDNPTPLKSELAVCVEVGEHLPAHRASWLVKYLTECSDSVLFSAAVPGQGGVYHINEQWPEYWHDLFHREGYVAFDTIRPQIAHDLEIAFWYRQNLFIYRRQSDVIDIAPAYIPSDFRLVHKTVIANREHLTLKMIIKKTPAALSSFFSHRLGRISHGS